MTDLLAADSWLVDDGRVRAVERHWARFARPAASTASRRTRSPSSAPTSRERCRRAGAGSPASSCAPTASSPSWCVRRLAREPTVVAWVADVPDPRREPRRKGPDLERLAALRERARRRTAPARRCSRRRRAPARGRVHEPAVVGGGDALRRARRRADPPRHHPRAAPRARARARHAGRTAPPRACRSWPTARPGSSAPCTASGSSRAGRTAVRRPAARRARRLAAPARRPDGPSKRLSDRNQRRPIANERCRSLSERHLRSDSLRRTLSRAYDPARSEGSGAFRNPCG